MSVVTPVYNGERYLRECIESVLAQTYRNWDYTIVNNCSTDRTLEIASEYAERDARIRICSNSSFVRVIENHNVAFRQISPASKYCKPLAADDLLLPECIERMVRLAEQHPSVGIVGAYGIYSSPEMGTYGRGVPYPQNVLPSKELCRAYLLRKGVAVFGAPTFVLFRSDIIRSRDKFYNESNIHADSEACLEVSEQHDFGFVHQILTFTRVRAGSLTSRSRELNTYLPYRLHVVTKYGPRHLSQEELDGEIRHLLDSYYGYLASQVWKRRGREFWGFHRAKLESVGHPLSVARLAYHLLSYVLDKLLNPKSTIEKLVQRMREASPTPVEGGDATVQPSSERSPGRRDA